MNFPYFKRLLANFERAVHEHANVGSYSGWWERYDAVKEDYEKAKKQILNYVERRI